uniref:Uncharacterized protein n=1 Tax=Sipha flava TaxID=143950 RepID=A0A2S2Q9V6_9HEMI
MIYFGILLILDLRPWFSRDFGDTNFHLTQALSGHGCFSYYLHRIGKLGTPKCRYCDASVDDASVCDAWHGRRFRLNIILGCDFSPQNMVSLMLRSSEHWLPSTKPSTKS